MVFGQTQAEGGAQRVIALGLAETEKPRESKEDVPSNHMLLSNLMAHADSITWEEEASLLVQKNCRVLGCTGKPPSLGAVHNPSPTYCFCPRSHSVCPIPSCLALSLLVCALFCLLHKRLFI